MASELIVTPELLMEVYDLSIFGLTESQVAKALSIRPADMQRAARDFPELQNALDQGRMKGVTDVAKSLYRNATEFNNVSAQTFFLKTRGDFKEETTVNHTGDIQLKPFARIWTDGGSFEEYEELEESSTLLIEHGSVFDLEGDESEDWLADLED